MKMTENKIREAVAELKSVNEGRLEKYSRNLRYYTNTPRIDICSMREPQIVGYLNINDGSEDDTSDTPNINVIKSCIDTLASKMAQSKVRPFFNCVNGSFKDIQICRQAQQFFDQFFDMENANGVVAQAFKNACIFETGVVYVDDINKSLRNVLPWQVYVRPAEKTYNKITRVYYEQADFPVTLLPENLKNKIKKSLDYVTYGIYYDTVNHIRAQYVTGEDKMIIEPFEGEKVPFIFLHYSNPIFGNSSISVVDLLKSIQQEINIIMSKIKDCSQLAAPLTYFVPDGSNIKATQLDNRAGNIITYRVTPDMPSQPITIATQPFIDGQYIQWVDNLVQKAYELVGISMLSAQSKKPTGVESGIGLQTLQDVESERFQTQLDQVIRCYVEMAKTCLSVFPQDEEILPDEETRLNIKWKDIVDEEKKMSIQFSAADSLSKDPSTKLQQLQMLAQSGIIPQSRIAQFLQIPDIESGYSLSNNAINAVLTIIDDCINNNNFNIPEFIPIQMLKEEIINTQLSLRAANYELNKDDIDKLTKLYEECDKLDEDMQQNAMDEQAEAVAKDAEMQNQIGKDLTQVPIEEGGIPKGENELAALSEKMSNADLDVSTQDEPNGGWR